MLRLPGWIARQLEAPGHGRRSLPKGAAGRRRRSGYGFAEDPVQGLKELEARLPPPGVETQPAYPPTYVHRDRLDPRNAAGGGLITDDQGNKRPHYHGHRERLRQRFLKGGHEPMPEYEILELVLFNAIPRIDVKPLAKRLLAEFGDLSGVVAAPEHRILQVAGATQKVFIQLQLAQAMAVRMSKARTLQRDVLSSWAALLEYCRTAMAHRDTEQFRVLYLDRKNTLIADEAQAEGTIDHVPVYPREIAKRCLVLNASAIILVHNHPSGDTTPSAQDVRMTDEVIAALSTLSVTVHDHVIVGKEAEYSFRRNGVL
ncbi:RadC family protein [Citreimonas salinaria]|uniref:DNA repair protein RadC n=1 Tax=Citreimonas salinaria TaxID=321339 RepID=A0A1H3MIR3_9RHOB|nr:DNA repair protein RadC [Citreimonas salinaria]SDY76009.1 DNA repair protein RadC [Citreimonas salinaria]